jgi:hypothetical protein
MLGEILLKMVSVLTPDDIKQMKAAGCGDEVRAILGDLDKLAVSWHDGERAGRMVCYQRLDGS